MIYQICDVMMRISIFLFMSISAFLNISFERQLVISPNLDKW